MNIFKFRSIVWMQFFISVFAGKDRFEALIVTKNKNTYELAEVYSPKYSQSKFRFMFNKVLKLTQYYHLCPDPTLAKDFPNKSKMQNKKALYVSKISRNITRKLICKNEIRPIIIKVTNAKKIYNVWRDNLELSHIGFQVYTANLKKEKKTMIKKCLQCFRPLFFQKRVQKEEYDDEMVNSEYSGGLENENETENQKNPQYESHIRSGETQDTTSQEDETTQEIYSGTQEQSVETESQSHGVPQSHKTESQLEERTDVPESGVEEVDEIEIEKEFEDGKKQKLNKNEKHDTNESIKYEMLDPEYDLIPVISLFFDKQINQVVIARYYLLSVVKQYNKPSTILYEDETVAYYDLTYFDNFFKYENQHKFFNELFNKMSYKYNNSEHFIVKQYLAPPEDFLNPIFSHLSRFNLNTTPIWFELHKKWVKIEYFVRIVAANIGNLLITNGVTGILSLPDENKNLKEVSSTKEENKITLPNLYWKTIEYINHNKNTDVGIIIIMHSNVFFKNSEKICTDICKKNGWPISNPSFNDGEIYCCSMEEETIKNLNAEFLTLTSKPVFDLNNWNSSELEKWMNRKFYA